jgi:hypothetical protein
MRYQTNCSEWNGQVELTEEDIKTAKELEKKIIEKQKKEEGENDVGNISS